MAEAQMIPEVRDTEIERLLREYAQPILRAAGQEKGRIRVRIVRSEVFNAFVIDGRSIYVHTGLLVQAKSPNQVIGVLAHEVGHIANGHLAALRDRIQRDQTKSLLIKLLGIGLLIAGGTSGSAGTSSSGSAVLSGGDEILLRSLLAERRSQESSADQSGLKYLFATRQSGRGMLETFEFFAQQEYVSDQYKDPFVRSHPVAAERLARLRDAVMASPFYGVTDPPALQLRHDLMRAKISGYLERMQIVFNKYPRTDTSLPARYARAIATFLGSGLDPALPLVDELIREKPDNPYFLEVKGDFYARSGKAALAVEPLRRSLKLAGDAPLIRTRLAEALLALEDPRFYPEILDLMRKTIIEDPDPRAYRAFALVNYKLGRRPQAELATAEAYFLEGDFKQAQTFARRAQAGLRNGESDWLRANEIVTFKAVAGQ
ncbi:MAG TPA: M48 family metalloprotease [Hyphomicrobiaceae bacterium]|nr:M48 family metalloprotease [Hyphomicrobiaceae bacterium]